LILAIGEILFDLFPESRRIGGAPFNFAYHLKQFGMPVTFISRIGKDSLGSDIISVLDKSGFDRADVQVDDRHSTGRVTVMPDGSGGHAFEIIPDVAYDYIEFPEDPAHIGGDAPVDLIYFGTLLQRTPTAFARLHSFLSKRSPHTRCFYDINLRPNCFNSEVIRESLKQADILKLNTDELRYLGEMFDRDLAEAPFILWLMAEFGIEVVALTRGDRGSDIFRDDAHRRIDPSGSTPVVDTVGAGDAYSAILAIGYLNGWPPDRILSIGTAFAAAICGIRGAVPEDADFYKPFLEKISGERHAG